MCGLSADSDRGEASCRPGENSALRALREGLPDATVDRFLATFLALLDQRVDLLAQLIADRRLTDAVTALLTLETSGRMAGADHLAAASSTLRHALESTAPSDLAPLVEQVRVAASETKHLLAD